MVLAAKKSWFKKTAKERTVQIWHLVCMGVGVIALTVAFCMWTGYIFAQNKFSGEAVLVAINESEHTRLKNKNDVNYSKTNKYDTYYNYKLTWQIMNPDSEKKYKFVTEEEKKYPGGHEYGEKQTVFVYYNNDETDYSMVDYSSSSIIALAGLAFIVFPVVDIVRAAAKKKKTEKRDRRAAQLRAAKTSAETNNNA